MFIIILTVFSLLSKHTNLDDVKWYFIAGIALDALCLAALGQ